MLYSAMPKRTHPIICKDTGEQAWEYADYLKTRHWRRFRTGYFKRYPKLCSECDCTGRRGNGIQLHHLNYDHLGDERDDDVVALCRRHHFERHRIEAAETKNAEEAAELRACNDEAMALIKKLREGAKKRKHRTPDKYSGPVVSLEGYDWKPFYKSQTQPEYKAWSGEQKG